MKFTSLSVRSSRVYVQRKETDFHTIYKDISPPLHYSIIVCPACHYAASQTGFNQPLPAKTAGQLSAALALMSAEKLNYGGERDLHTALASFQLAIRSAQLRKAPAAEIAGLILGAAWIAREQDAKDLENIPGTGPAFYLQAYQQSEHSIANMSEVQAAYLIGELYLRLDQYNEAVNWFNHVISYHNVKSYPAIEKLARDEWAAAREESRKQILADKPVEEEPAKQPPISRKTYPGNSTSTSSNGQSIRTKTAYEWTDDAGFI